MDHLISINFVCLEFQMRNVRLSFFVVFAILIFLLFFAKYWIWIKSRHGAYALLLALLSCRFYFCLQNSLEKSGKSRFLRRKTFSTTLLFMYTHIFCIYTDMYWMKQRDWEIRQVKNMFFNASSIFFLMLIKILSSRIAQYPYFRFRKTRNCFIL